MCLYSNYDVIDVLECMMVVARKVFLTERLYRKIMTRWVLRCRQCSRELNVGKEIVTKSASSGRNTLYYCVNCASKLHIMS